AGSLRIGSSLALHILIGFHGIVKPRIPPVSSERMQTRKPNNLQPTNAQQSAGSVKRLFEAHDAPSAARIVTIFGSLSGIVYAIFAVVLGQQSIFKGSVFNNPMFIVGFTLLLLAYRFGFDAIKKFPAVGTRRIALLGCLVSFAALCVPVFNSLDIFAYV